MPQPPMDPNSRAYRHYAMAQALLALLVAVGVIVFVAVLLFS